ncbi:DNA circularization protein [Sphingorhabdus sp. 109]|uniref:DNA circularization protein n=1 Tax=Sphingorhabdus sp. 109 TaxID=2653173 RepID=UPI0012F059A0|nr:DNA circularization N-terminal domain-containing protein [Sphingorhabdus sp. 109]VWX62604.1 conserved hypothetical protein [Sphingorhabdus sp. 109]
MSWRDEYQPGSFRGAGFRTQRQETFGGRRIVTHEYPGRNDPTTEDLGARAKTYTLECHVLGNDYFADRDALQDALEGEGPGQMIHPWLGAMMLVVLDFTFTESTAEGGIAYFTVTFGEAGLAVDTPQAIDGRAQALSVADAIDAEAPGGFAGDFSIAGLPGFVETAADDIVNGAVAVTQFVAGVGGGVGPALRAFDATLRFLPDSLANLLRMPISLGQAIHNMVLAVSALQRTPRRKAAIFLEMIDYGEDLKPVLPITPARIRQRDNQDALIHLFRVLCASALVRAVADISFTSYDEAVAVRDRISDRFDILALAAADDGQDARADAFDRLRRAMVRDVTQRGGSLARIYDYRILSTQPALVIANRLYGHQNSDQQADDIAMRNNIPHPGFIPGGASITVLSETGGSDG